MISEYSNLCLLIILVVYSKNHAECVQKRYINVTEM